MSATLENMIQHNIFDLLDQIDEDPVLFWVFAEDNQWHLCCQCDICEEWLEFPGIPHICRGIIPWADPAIGLRVLQYRETCIEELTADLLCEETLLEDQARAD